MSRKFTRIENRRASKRYTPHPHPEVTQALEAAGLKPERVYAARRWERSTIDLDALACALHGLTCKGWRLSPVRVYAVRYPAERRASEAGFPALPLDDLDRARRLEIDRARGLAYVFDRTPDSIEWHLGRFRAIMANLNADPIRRLMADPEYNRFLTKAEFGALATFIAAFGKFHAAIGNGAFTVSAGEGVPMTEEAREAAQDNYKWLCADIIRNAGPRALSACQDLAANRSRPSKWLLRGAAHAIDPDSKAGDLPNSFEAARAGE